VSVHQRPEVAEREAIYDRWRALSWRSRRPAARRREVIRSAPQCVVRHERFHGTTWAKGGKSSFMLKLIGIIVAVLPFVLFLRAVFGKRLRQSPVVAEFKRQIDYMVWAILILVAVAVVYSIGKLILS
jgi:hypothetical protein